MNPDPWGQLVADQVDLHRQHWVRQVKIGEKKIQAIHKSEGFYPDKNVLSDLSLSRFKNEFGLFHLVQLRKLFNEAYGQDSNHDG
jgi:hypothetical protein